MREVCPLATIEAFPRAVMSRRGATEQLDKDFLGTRYARKIHIGRFERPAKAPATLHAHDWEELWYPIIVEGEVTVACLKDGKVTRLNLRPENWYRLPPGLPHQLRFRGYLVFERYEVLRPKILHQERTTVTDIDAFVDAEPLQPRGGN